MPIKYGSKVVNDVFYGNKRVLQIYQGSKLVYNAEIGLPSGYTQLEYIESTGTQYILIPSKKYVVNEELEIDFAYTSFAGQYPTVYGNPKSEIYTNITGSVLVYGNISTSEPQIFELNQKQTIKAKFTDTFQAMQGLFSYIQSNGAPYYFSCGRMYKFIDRVNGVDIFNMIPAMRNSDGEIGLYDTVSRQFFTNAGTGAFTSNVS